ncbi:MAG: GNAT family N-acetyltransferase [Bradyrhizobium sp.]
MDIETHHGDRLVLQHLFALADDSETQIASYIALGEVLVACDGDGIIGHLQILEAGEAGAYELKSMAVDLSRQREGIGCSLVAAAVTLCRSRHGRRLIVSTAAADIGNLRFYQRQGFRMYRVVQDAFRPDTGYPDGIMIDGIALRDQVFLELTL